MYSRANIYQTYHQDSILTASPVELVVMLYDALIRNLKLAKIHIEAKSTEKAGNSLIKAQDILAELIRCLDLRYPIGKQLLNLYEYMLQQIVDINIKKEAEGIDGIVDMLDDLKDAWKGIKSESSLLRTQEQML